MTFQISSKADKILKTNNKLKPLNVENNLRKVCTNSKFSSITSFETCSNLIDDIKAFIFYLNERGPELTYKLESYHSPFSEADIMKMGTFYYMAVGQGNSGRNSGLFELPVPGYPEFHAFIYAFEVMDNNIKDPRANGKNYCLLVITHPRWFRKFLLHSWKLEMLIQEFLLPYYKLEDYRSKELTEKLLKVIIPDIPTVLQMLEEEDEDQFSIPSPLKPITK